MSDIALRPQPLLAHWAPGAILTVVGSYCLTWNGVALYRLRGDLSGTLLIPALAVFSFGLGQVLDAFRDGVMEDLFDKIGELHRSNSFLNWIGLVEVEWKVFVDGESQHVENLEVWFFSHYMLSFNLGVGLLLLSLYPMWGLLGLRPAVWP